MKNKSSNKPAWVQLYEARRPPSEIQTRTPGRPPLPIPRKKIGLTLSQGEISELKTWRERLSKILDRRVSYGEVVGILSKISSARYQSLNLDNIPDSLDDLASLLVGEEE